MLLVHWPFFCVFWELPLNSRFLLLLYLLCTGAPRLALPEHDGQDIVFCRPGTGWDKMHQDVWQIWQNQHFFSETLCRIFATPSRANLARTSCQSPRRVPRAFPAKRHRKERIRQRPKCVSVAPWMGLVAASTCKGLGSADCPFVFCPGHGRP